MHIYIYTHTLFVCIFTTYIQWCDRELQRELPSLYIHIGAHCPASSESEVEVSNADSIAPSSDTSADGRASRPKNEKEAQAYSHPSFPEAALGNTAGTCYGDPGAAEQLPVRVADPEGPQNMPGMESTDMPAYVIADFFWNVGSNGHALSACRPCNFFHGTGCSRGRSCKFCHVCPRGKARQRRMKLKRGLRNAAQLEEPWLLQVCL